MPDIAAPDAPDWITTTEAAEISGFSSQWVRELCDEGDVTCRKFGRNWQVSRTSLLAYVESERRPGPKTD